MGVVTAEIQGAVGYEVYLRSFADATGDGVGDLHGLRERLGHLAWLGVDIVWITPCHPSPLADHGYDVADYLDVSGEYGGIEALDRVFEAAHELGMRVLLDLVPNHTSNRHPWFEASRADRDSPYRDYYIWRDPAPGGGPPNNWVSHFGGPAWTYDEHSGQYYCHLFLPEQPDLNWANEAVSAEFEAIIEFWLGRGADGFRIDVAHALAKHPELPDLPPAAVRGEADPDDLMTVFDRLEHVYDSNRPEVLEIYRRWREVADAHNGLILGEVYLLESDALAPYVAARDGLHLTFWFAPLHLRADDADGLRRALAEGCSMAPGSVAWITSSHDSSRAATRFGGGPLGRARALAVAALQFGLPGVAFLYQGEELGLEDVEVPPDRAQDPTATRAGAPHRSRDVARTPMPWEPGGGLGFTSSERPWLPLGDRDSADTVAVQRDDPDALLHRYRELTGVRHTHLMDSEVPVEWLTNEGPVIAYRRAKLVVAANIGAEALSWQPPGSARPLWRSSPRPPAPEGTLAPGEAVWLELHN